jgi:hypothetical protein
LKGISSKSGIFVTFQDQKPKTESDGLAGIFLLQIRYLDNSDVLFSEGLGKNTRGADHPFRAVAEVSTQPLHFG